MPAKFFLYLLQCRDKSYYCGYTHDLQKRVATHNAGRGGHYTKSHRPVKLVYFEHFGTQKKAMRRERQIKTYSHQKKLELIQKQAKNRLKPLKKQY